MYLTYEEYKNYGGTLSEAAFNNVEYEARVKIDYYTFNRLCADTMFSEKVKRATHKIVVLMTDYNNYMDKVSDMNNPIMNSSSNDGVSVSYGGYAGNTSTADISSMSKKLDRDVYDVIKQYLYGECNQEGETLLYRGVCR